MEVKEFQEKLVQLCALAEDHNKILSGIQVKEFFEGCDLDRSQLIKVLQYLKTMGITIQGTETAENTAESTADGTGEAAVQEPEKKILPLTAEEQVYLNEYLTELGIDKKIWESNVFAKNVEQESVKGLLKKIATGDEDAKRSLTQLYMPVAARMAVEMNCEGIFIADLIQEANLGLLMALTQPAEGADENWLLNQIKTAIIGAIEEQTQRKFSDDCLVAKVEKLESAVRELSDDEEDEESKFSINELAIILDMDADEIRDVLRLTGDAQ